MGTQKIMHAIQQDFHISHLEKKVKLTISNCIECITHNQKLGKHDDFLHAIKKGDTPFSTLHVDHLGSLDLTSKSYRYIFAQGKILMTLRLQPVCQGATDKSNGSTE